MRENNRKKLALVLLTMITVIAGSTMVYAETSGDFEYSVIDGTGDVIITKYNGNGGDVVIPSTIDGKTVKQIGLSMSQGPFQNCTNLISVTIPSGVTLIEDDAFAGCSKLTNISIPSTVTEIGSGIFSGCSSLTSIDLPSELIGIYGPAFSGCSSLTSIDIPYKVWCIGNEAFSDCSSLTSVNIPDKSELLLIGESAFSNCSKLKSIDIPSTVTKIDNFAFSGCIGFTSIEIPASVETIGYNPFVYCSNLETIKVVAGNNKYTSNIDSKECNGIFTKDGKELISGCVKTQLMEGMTTISRSAFEGCEGLESADIPSGFDKIDYAAFKGCKKLKSIHYQRL